MRITIRIAASALFAASILSTSEPAVGQQVQGSVLWESYSFDGAVPYQDISELSLPVLATIPLGQVGELSVATTYVRVGLSLLEDGSVQDQVISGLADTEVRLSLNVVRDRLVLLTTASVPTGMEGFEADELDVLNLLVTDVLGFYTRRLGSGGSVGGGLVGAIPAGKMAVGIAGTYTRFGEFDQLAGQQPVKPGAELRLRGGLEGAVGDRTYLRTALIVARRSNDQFGGEELPGVGNRFGGYLTVDQGIGSSNLSLYVFDLFRSDPQIGQSTFGSPLPRGNLFALGTRLTIPVGRETSLVPRIEWRRSDRAPDPTSDRLEELGDALRLGADLTFELKAGTTLALQGDGLFGSVEGGAADVSGYRLGVTLTVRP